MSNIDKLRRAAMHAKTMDDWGCDADNFHDKATPDAVLALLDELENKQTFQQAFFRQSLMYDVVAEAYEEAKEQIAKDVEIKARLCRESNSLFDRLRAAEKRIAELEVLATSKRPYPMEGGKWGCSLCHKRHHENAVDAALCCAAAGKGE